MKFRKPKKHEGLFVNGNETKQEVMASHYDPNGSYTGIPTGPFEDEVPVQDSDDL